jgi:hypothetical protein
MMESHIFSQKLALSLWSWTCEMCETQMAMAIPKVSMAIALSYEGFSL